MGRYNTIYGDETEIKKKGRRSNGVNKDGCDNVEGGKKRKYGRGVEDRVGNERGRDLVVVYIPPKINAWGREEYGNLLKDTYNCLKNMIENSNNIIFMGDFNCKEVCWEKWFTEGGEESWGNVLLNLVLNNIMTQWIKENTRFRGEEPSRLLTEELEVIK